MPEKQVTNRRNLLAPALLIGFLIISPPRCTHIDATTTAHANANASGDRTTRNLRAAGHEDSNHQFTFAVTADIRCFSGPSYHTPQYFKEGCEVIAGAGSGAFIVIPGDIDPTTDVNWTITQTLGITYTWYPMVGNHELPNAGYEPYPGANMDWLRAHDYGTVNPGPLGSPTDHLLPW